MSDTSRCRTFYRIDSRSVRLKIVKVLKNKIIQGKSHRSEETWKTRSVDCVLERKEDINEKTDDVQRKSKVNNVKI